ncbi:MAG: DUF4058 family protein [Planctomycetota bacterium]|nr:DUF4058 family protein [Planctomycetota bacterium]MDA1141644.1 DUF4058 family protein [Planctomycetota bacterium]
MKFPGMDPYLENPRFWPGVHNSLIVYLRDYLRPQLEPKYVASVEERVFVEGPNRDIIPDVLIERERAGQRSMSAVMEADSPVLVMVEELEIRESYIEILNLHSDMEIVTVIEVVSPSNKTSGPGRDSYLRKQHEVCSSSANLVEIDLLRAGEHLLAVPEYKSKGRGHYDYLVSVNRSDSRSVFELYLHTLQERLKRIRIPLANGDPDAVLDLQAVVEQTYQAGSYQYRIKYDELCNPSLRPELQEWASTFVAQV